MKGRAFAKKIIVLLLSVVVILGQFIACAYTTWEEGKLKVIATTTMIADLCRQVGGDTVSVIGIMNYGIDPHSYMPTAQNIARIKEADIIVYNGLHLEARMSEVFDRLEHTVAVTGSFAEQDLLVSEDGADAYDPHVWFSVPLWKKAASYVAQRFAHADAQNAEQYFQNYALYAEELDKLDAYIRQNIDLVPPTARVLITAHDAFGYFGREYGLEVMGIQGLSTATEAGISRIDALAQHIRNRQVKAVFAESSVNERNLQSLIAAVKSGGEGAEVQLGGELYSDSLGEKSKGHHTYIGAFRHNVEIITAGLLGSAL